MATLIYARVKIQKQQNKNVIGKANALANRQHTLL